MTSTSLALADRWRARPRNIRGPKRRVIRAMLALQAETTAAKIAAEILDRAGVGQPLPVGATLAQSAAGTARRLQAEVDADIARRIGGVR